MPESLLNMTTSSAPTAGIIVIGDEILKGQIQDANTVYLAKELKTCGIKVERVLILPDDVDEIAEEVRDFCGNYTYVFTCGGVGPTHDDVTFEGVAKGFNDELMVNQKIKEVLQMHFKNQELTDSMLKMAKVPKMADVDYSRTGTNSFPVITLKNLFILPGIPKLLQQTFHVIRTDLLRVHAKSHKTTVRQCYIKSSEFFITDKLNHLVEKYKDSVVFGSYPSWNHNYYETKLTIEANEESVAEEVVQEIRKAMEVVEFDQNPLQDSKLKLDAFLSSCNDNKFVEQVSKAQEVIKECFERYGADEIAIAFNGGKDCMVLLHLTHVFLQANPSLKNHRLQALYIRDSDPFPIVEEFIEECQKMYDLDLRTIQSSMKDALTKMLNDRPCVKAILMGTRMGDPGSKGQSFFSPTDGNWPSVMRVNPIINWDYPFVWQFLRSLSLPYPVLYDRGYTSLGGKSNTSPNPNLAFTDDKGIKKFKPAFELEDGAMERAGRGKKAS